MKRAVLIALPILASCSIFGLHQPKPPDPEFDAAATAPFLEPGKNEIKGSALLRQQNGGIVSCAGYPVHLVPVTPFSEWWFHKEFDFSDSEPDVGFDNGDSADERGFTDNSPFAKATKSTLCDVQGVFDFPDIADGSFFLVTKIHWNIPGLVALSTTIGTVTKKVTVAGGQKISVVLSH